MPGRLDILTALGALVAGPVAAVAAHALDEPEYVTARARARAALHARVAAAAHHAVLAAGALALPPQAGRHLYATWSRCARTSPGTASPTPWSWRTHLTGRLGVPAPGGHRFGDDLGALRVRLSTGPLLGNPASSARSPSRRRSRWTAACAHALGDFGSAFDELR